jgi:hypothetical protein
MKSCSQLAMCAGRAKPVMRIYLQNYNHRVIDRSTLKEAEVVILSGCLKQEAFVALLSHDQHIRQCSATHHADNHLSPSVLCASLYHNMPRKPACQALELPRFHPQPPPVQTRNLHTDSDTLWTRTNSKEIPSRSRAIQSQHVHENVLDLALRTIGAVCALLFGIWAPLSYQLQKDGNKGNDAAQEELVRLRKEVEVMNRQMKWTGLLKILEICEKGNSVQVISLAPDTNIFGTNESRVLTLVNN